MGDVVHCDRSGRRVHDRVRVIGIVDQQHARENGRHRACERIHQPVVGGGAACVYGHHATRVEVGSHLLKQLLGRQVEGYVWLPVSVEHDHGVAALSCVGATAA